MASFGALRCALRRSSRCERSDVYLYRRHSLRGLYERKGSKALTRAHSREELAPVFADLNKYDATTHFIGQSTLFTLESDRATGEAYCLAHHVTVDSGKKRLMVASLRYSDTLVKKRLMVASLRYSDTLVKIDGSWFFAERL